MESDEAKQNVSSNEGGEITHYINRQKILQKLCHDIIQGIQYVRHKKRYSW